MHPSSGRLIVDEKFLTRKHYQVAQIIPLGSNFAAANTRIQALNAAIPPWAQAQNKTESPIWVVDQYTGFGGTADNRDGVHPNDAGDTKMMNIWYPAIIRAFEAAQKDKQSV